MNEALKQRQREKAKAKRGRLLKDCEPFTLLIAADYVEDREVSPILGVRLAYLKYASQEQIDALRGRIPSREVNIPIYDRDLRQNRPRKVVCFDLKFLMGILQFLVTSPGKYYREVWEGYVNHH